MHQGGGGWLVGRIPDLVEPSLILLLDVIRHGGIMTGMAEKQVFFFEVKFSDGSVQTVSGQRAPG